MVDKESGQRIAALATALCRVPWIRHLFCAPLFGSGVSDRANPHTNIPLPRAHTLRGDGGPSNV